MISNTAVSKIPIFETLFLKGVSWEELELTHQKAISEVHLDSNRAYLIVSEPKPTLSAGRSAKPSDLLWTSLELQKHLVMTAHVDRGGGWTYHGPGQVVVYPVFNLKRFAYTDKSVSAYLGHLSEAIRRVLETWGVHTAVHRKPYGIYVGDKKLASFGIRFHQGICSHGFALYQKPQFFFKAINPCGVPGQSWVSLEELGIHFSWEYVAQSLTEKLKEVWER